MQKKSGLDFCGESREENVRFLYKSAVEARNFHYDNFTKWQTFFYVAVGSVLVAYCTLVFDSDGYCCREAPDPCLRDFFKIFLPILGYIFSLIWLCSSKGYTYWWNAYMKALCRFEGENILGWEYDEDGKRRGKEDHRDKRKNNSYAVYNAPRLDSSGGIFNPFGGANFSTSKLSNALAFVSASAWGGILMFSWTGAKDACSWVFVLLTPAIFTWLLGVPVMQVFFSSEIDAFIDKCTCDLVRQMENFFVKTYAYICASALLFLFFVSTIGRECLDWKKFLACTEVWVVVSALLFLLLKKIWKYLN